MIKKSDSKLLPLSTTTILGQPPGLLETAEKYVSYRRTFIPEGTWFVIASMLWRYRNDLLVCEKDLLREAVKRVRKHYPFQFDAWVVLLEHMHCVWIYRPAMLIIVETTVDVDV